MPREPWITAIQGSLLMPCGTVTRVYKGALTGCAPRFCGWGSCGDGCATIMRQLPLNASCQLVLTVHVAGQCKNLCHTRFPITGGQFAAALFS